MSTWRVRVWRTEMVAATLEVEAATQDEADNEARAMFDGDWPALKWEIIDGDEVNFEDAEEVPAVQP